MNFYCIRKSYFCLPAHTHQPRLTHGYYLLAFVNFQLRNYFGKWGTQQYGKSCFRFVLSRHCAYATLAAYIILQYHLQYSPRCLLPALGRFVSVTWSYLSAACRIKLESWNLFGLAYINMCSKPAPSPYSALPRLLLSSCKQGGKNKELSLSTDIICEFLEWIPAETPPSIRQHLMRKSYTLWFSSQAMWIVLIHFETILLSVLWIELALIWQRQNHSRRQIFL